MKAHTCDAATKKFSLQLHPDEVRIVGAGLLLIGGLVLLVSIIGSIGANREKVLLLMMVSNIRAQTCWRAVSCDDITASSLPVPGSAHRAGPGSALHHTVAADQQRQGDHGIQDVSGHFK